MSTRLSRFDGHGGEEIIDPYDGFEPLRQRIMDAHRSGDRELLLKLQDQYRRRPARGRSGIDGTISTRAVAPVASNVVRTAASAVVREAGDVTLQMKGY